MTVDRTGTIEPTRAPADDDEGPQFDVRSDRWLLGATALVPGVLLLLGLGGVLTGMEPTATLALLAGHFIAQLIVLFIYCALLMNDTSLGRAWQVMWGIAFLVAAPVALPVYYWVRVRRDEPPESRIEVCEP